MSMSIEMASIGYWLLIHQVDRVLPSFLSFLIESLVTAKLAAYEPAKQTRSVLLYWRTPEEWGEVLHEWVRYSNFSFYPNSESCLTLTTGNFNWAD